MLSKSDFEKFQQFVNNTEPCPISDAKSWGYEEWNKVPHQTLVELKCLIDKQKHSAEFDSSRSGLNGYFDRVFVKKGWGHEEWIWNGEYCGKILSVLKDKKCSWHFHNLKDEVFFIRSGKIKLFVNNTDDLDSAEILIMHPGESYHVARGTRHRFYALEDSEIIEFSTKHFDSDSIRVIQGD